MDRPSCDWWVTGQGRCHRYASFRWGKRYICANHAAGWLRQGKYMERLPGVRNPYPGNDWMWGMTSEAQGE